MDCAQVQEEMLDSLDEPPSAASLRAIDDHLDGCAACAAFAAKQRALDAQLMSSLVAPGLPDSFRPRLRDKVRRERMRASFDALPDLVHLGSCALATVGCALLVPIDAALVLGAGATMTMVSYAAMAALRSALDDPDR
jgi:anti-sigma factor RsiW